MAKKSITNGQLWIIERDIENIRNRFPALAFFQENRFESFLQRNQIHLKSLHAQVHAIQKKYIEHNVNDEPQYTINENKEKDWKYLPSVVDKKFAALLTGNQVKEAYKKEVTDFLNNKITVEL